MNTPFPPSFSFYCHLHSATAPFRLASKPYFMHAQQTVLNAPHFAEREWKTIWMENIVKGTQRTQSGCWILGEPERWKSGKILFSSPGWVSENWISNRFSKKHNRKWGGLKAQRLRWKDFESNKKQHIPLSHPTRSWRWHEWHTNFHQHKSTRERKLH